MEHSFDPDSHQDVGFPLGFHQQQDQELTSALQGEIERAWLCTLPRDMSSVPPSPGPSFWGHTL